MPRSPEARMQSIGVPKLEGRELERVYDVNVSDEELRTASHFAHSDPENFAGVVAILSGPNLLNYFNLTDSKTPLQEENQAICKELQLKARKLYGRLQLDADYNADYNPLASDRNVTHPKLGRTLVQDASLLRDVSKLYCLELRKAQWLDEKYYPHVFGKTINVARAEVTQMLIETYNRIGDGSIPQISTTPIVMRNTLTYLKDRSGHIASEAFHHHQLNKIVVRIFLDDSPESEWGIYVRTVHELVHSISYAMDFKAAQSSRTPYSAIHVNHARSFLNKPHVYEALTDLTAYFISKKHAEKDKTPLSRKENIDLGNAGYFEWILPFAQELDKIAPVYFFDALVRKEGLSLLVNKFTEVYDDPEAFTSFMQRVNAAAKKFHEYEQAQLTYKGSAA